MTKQHTPTTPSATQAKKARTDSVLPSVSASESARIIGGYIGRHKIPAILTVVLYMLSTYLGSQVALIIGQTIDNVNAGAYSDYPWQPLAILAGVTVLEAIAVTAIMYTSGILGALVTRDISADTIDSALNLDARSVEEAGSGDLLTRVTDDISALSAAIGYDLPETIYVLFYFIMSTVVLATASPALALVFVPMLIGLAFLMGYFLPRIAAQQAVRQAASSELNTVVTENIRGAETIEELGIGRERAQVFEHYNMIRYREALALVALRIRYATVDATNSWIPTLLTLAWGALCVANGWASWGAVATASIMVFSLRLMSDLLNNHIEALRKMLVNMGRVFGIRELEEQQEQQRALIEVQDLPAPSEAMISLRNISFSYDAGHPVLEDITLDIAAGECVALAGRSGSGKTTLARLMSGSLAPDTGHIWVGGRLVRAGQYPTDAAADGRPRLLVCTQEAHVFYGTLADNLLMVAPNASEEQMHSALDAVTATWWRELPDALNTDLGEHELTSDQSQQLALARIVLADPHAVVLDESTTHLELADARESLRAVLENRAVVIISHDARIASLADRAVMLSDHRISADGPVAEVFTY